MSNAAHRATGRAGLADSRHGRPESRTVTDVMLDLDGCVWFGSELAPRAAEVVAELRAAGLGVGFLTNISSGSTATVAAKLSGLGIPTTEADVLMPIAALAAHPLLASAPRVYVLARQEVAAAVSKFAAITDDEYEADLVVVGRDPELTYHDLAAAVQVLDRGAGLLALNLDTRVPVEDGRIMPGNGAIAAALTAASGVAAESVGKPSRFFFDTALARFGFRRDSTVMVGDTLDSDIAGGAAAGLLTVHVGGSLFSLLDPTPEPDHSLRELADLPALLFGHHDD